MCWRRQASGTHWHWPPPGRAHYNVEVDNAAAATVVAFIKSKGSGKSGLRHIDLRLNWIRKLHGSCLINAFKVSTLHNASDIGTKILDHQRLIWLRSRWYHAFPMYGGPTKLEYDKVLDTTPDIDDVDELVEQELQELVLP